MDNKLSSLLEQSRQAVKYWWLLLLTGIALFILGIVVFLYPGESYLQLAMLFGAVILVSGVFQIVLAASNKHFLTGRGWMLAGGIIETILGIILVINPGISALTMPVFLAFWLMFRGFSAIGLAGDMNLMNVGGAAWALITGILSLIVAIWILCQPLIFGTTAVIIWIGISLLFAGISTSSFSLQLRNLHKKIQ